MKKVSVIWIVLVQWVLAYEWLHAGYGKWTSPAFMNSIGGTLVNFAENSKFEWYTNFLRTSLIPNAELAGNIIRSSELLIAIAFILGGALLLRAKPLNWLWLWFLILAFFGGAAMNLNFYLPSGRLSPSSAGINILMGLIQIIFGICYLANYQEMRSGFEEYQKPSGSPSQKFGKPGF